MRQLLLRVPDELHRRLAARAEREGRSVNALATEILGTSVDADTGSARDVVRARAVARGVFRPAPAPAQTAPDRAELLDQLRSVRLTAAQLIDEERGGTG